jgi:DNA-binding transcriptional ArsR family regulator
MVNKEATLDVIFGALSDRTRRGMLTRLAEGPATIGQLGQPFEISKGAVTKHVKVLERSGLLRRDVQGRIHRCTIDPDSLARAAEWVEQVRAFWEARFSVLADYLDEMQEQERRR